MAYIPCISALPSVRANASPKRLEKNESTDSSSSSSTTSAVVVVVVVGDGEFFCFCGRFAGVNGSASTDLSTRRPNGSVNSERRPEGSGCNPSVGGTCKNLFRAAGDPCGVQITSERKSRRCTYRHASIHHQCHVNQSGMCTSSKMDLAFGRIVRGPASSSMRARFP